MGTFVKMIVSAFFKYALPVAAGIGAGSVLDKFAGDKLPNYPAGGVAPALTGDKDGKTSFSKIAYIMLAVTIGGVALSFLLKKLKVKI